MAELPGKLLSHTLSQSIVFMGLVECVCVCKNLKFLEEACPLEKAVFDSNSFTVGSSKFVLDRKQTVKSIEK